MGKLVPVGIVLLALAGGAGVGHVLRPAPEPESEAEQVAAEEAPAAPAQESLVALDDPFLIPVLRDGQVWSHVVLTLGVSSTGLAREDILLREPLLRDGLMEALFVHGSLGGFEGDFTEPQAMIRLRRRLDEMVARRLGDPEARALIVSMARQAG